MYLRDSGVYSSAGLHHPLNRHSDIFCLGAVVLGRCRNAARPQWFREHKHVARTRARFSQQPVRMHETNRRKPDLRLLILDGVSPGDDRPGLAHFFRQPKYDLAGHVHRKLRRQRGDVQRQNRARAHRVNIAERIGRGDRAVAVRVVYNRREEVRRDDERVLRVQPVHRSVIGRANANQQIGVICRIKHRLDGAQNLRQGRRGQLRRSPSARG